MADLDKLIKKNPYFIAAGPAKYGRGYAIYENPISWFLFRTHLINPADYGGVTTNTLTLKPLSGNYRWYAPWRAIRPVPGGYLNRKGWTNIGIERFIDTIYPKLKVGKIIPSIGAVESEDEIFIMLDKLNRIDIPAVEINESCPHVNIALPDNLSELGRFFYRAAQKSSHPLIIKLGPDSKSYKKAITAESAGIKAISAINTVPDYMPGLGRCGRSGPDIKKIALRTVERIAGNVAIPVIGGGGIMNEADVKDFFSAGAKAVFFCSIFFTKPLVPGRIVRRALWI